MDYIVVEFTCVAIEDWQQDLLVNDLADIGFDTFEDTDKGFDAFIPEPNFNPATLETVLIQLPQEVEIIYEVRTIAHQNWNEIWESNFQPISIGERCYVRATFHEPKPEFPLEIVIDPKMAFGTGHHQTTSLMMETLLDEDLKDKTVLDMGCGTGILGILALKLGAKSVVAIDNDPACFESTKENSKLNAVTGISAICGGKSVIPDEKFEVIIANINRNILLDQIANYANAIDKDGILLMSGFYEGDDLDILKTKASNEGFEYMSHKTRDRWVAAKFRRI